MVAGIYSFLGGPPIQWDDDSVKDEFMSLRGTHAPYGAEIPKPLAGGQYFGDGKYQVINVNGAQGGWESFVPPGYVKVGNVAPTWTNPPPKTGGRTQQISPALMIVKRREDPKPAPSAPAAAAEEPVVPYTPFTFNSTNPKRPSEISWGRVPTDILFPENKGADINQLLSNQAKVQSALANYNDAKRERDMTKMLTGMQDQTRFFLAGLGKGAEPQSNEPSSKGFAWTINPGGPGFGMKDYEYYKGQGFTDNDMNDFFKKNQQYFGPNAANVGPLVRDKFGLGNSYSNEVAGTPQAAIDANARAAYESYRSGTDYSPNRKVLLDDFVSMLNSQNAARS